MKKRDSYLLVTKLIALLLIFATIQFSASVMITHLLYSMGLGLGILSLSINFALTIPFGMMMFTGALSWVAQDKKTLTQ